MRKTWNEEKYSMSRRTNFIQYLGWRYWETPPMILPEAIASFLPVWWDMYEARGNLKRGRI